MNDMKPYFRAIEVYNNALMVRVIFPSNWKVYDRQDSVIKVTPSETNANEVIYYADSADATYEDIFDLVEETIKANQDIVLKLKLLKDKVEELKEMFSRLPFEELKTLKFVTEKVKEVKPKRKYTKKKKEEEKAAEEPMEVIPAEELYPEKIKVEESRD
jgi:hypothetical protein